MQFSSVVEKNRKEFVLICLKLRIFASVTNMSFKTVGSTAAIIGDDVAEILIKIVFVNDFNIMTFILLETFDAILKNINIKNICVVPFNLMFQKERLGVLDVFK